MNGRQDGSPYRGWSPSPDDAEFARALTRLVERDDKGALAELRRLPSGAALGAVLSGPNGRLLPISAATDSRAEDDYLPGVHPSRPAATPRGQH